MTSIAQIAPSGVVIGVDTHKDVHVAVALDTLGRRLGETQTSGNGVSEGRHGVPKAGASERP